MGPSGSGKSTLLHCMAGLDSLTSGAVFIGDTDLTTLDDKRLTLLRREQVGFVFQSFNLVPTLTAEENITLPLGTRWTPGRSRVAAPARERPAPRRPTPPSTIGAVRRPAATRRRGAGDGDPPRADLRRRTDRQPRFEIRHGDVGDDPRRGRGIRTDGRDGDPRRAGCQPCRPGPVRRRRADPATDRARPR